MLLSLKDVKIYYGKAEAIKGVTIEVAEGSVTGLIGANGAGKSTILRAISGLKPVTSGEILFQNKRINGKASHNIMALGIVQVPEGRRLFPHMTVLENIRMGAFLRKDRVSIGEDLDGIWRRFAILNERRGQRAETLSGGEQQMLAIARALMARPKLLLMDEPSLGLAPLVVEELADIIRSINKEGISVLLVEQNAGLAFSVTERTYVLEVGKIVLEGATKEIMNHELVGKAFLGI
jgi:branched-chain amino acid transport system ATP-binding protein